MHCMYHQKSAHFEQKAYFEFDLREGPKISVKFFIRENWGGRGIKRFIKQLANAVIYHTRKNVLQEWHAYITTMVQFHVR